MMLRLGIEPTLVGAQYSYLCQATIALLPLFIGHAFPLLNLADVSAGFCFVLDLPVTLVLFLFHAQV